MFLNTEQPEQKCNTHLVKSGGTGVVTNEAMGFRWTCWNIIRISELLDISSLLLQDRNYGGKKEGKKNP